VRDSDEIGKCSGVLRQCERSYANSRIGLFPKTFVQCLIQTRRASVKIGSRNSSHRTTR
jgi:hypothetical protein